MSICSKIRRMLQEDWVPRYLWPIATPYVLYRWWVLYKIHRSREPVDDVRD